MATYYIDMVNGSDAAAGTSWGTAWKTPNSGSTAARIAPGDTIRMAKSPDKISLGNGTWTSVTSTGQPNTTSSVTGATNATPIQITVANHGWATGDVVSINGVTGNTAANGVWIITNTGTNTFTLDGSVGNGAFGGSPTAQNINFRSVKLATAATKLVTDCNTNWTAANGSTVAANTTSVVKTPPQGIQVTAPASALNNTLYAYFPLGSTQDFSAYTHLTFWMIAATQNPLATTWRLCLCSDTVGAVIVDSIPLPAISTGNQILSLVLPRTGGGNLGSAIQSIALYTGANSLNNSLVAFDNISACTATGLNLQSVISPVASNTDVYENYPIAGIINNIVLLDNGYTAQNLNSTGLRGYSGSATGTITTYHRNAIDYAGVNGIAYATITGAMGDCSEAGTVTAITTWSGGWNTSTDTQESVTLVYIPAASVGWTPKDYNKVEWMGILRGLRAYGTNTLQGRTYSGWTISNSFASGPLIGYSSQAPSVLTGVLYPNTITNFGVTNTTNPGVVTGNQQLNCDSIKLLNCNLALPVNVVAAAFVNSGGVCVFKNTEVYNSAQPAILNSNSSSIFYNTTAKYNAGLTYTSGTAYFNKVTTTDNSNIFFVPTGGNLDGGNQYIQDITYNEATPYSNTAYALGNSYMSGLNGTANNFLGYTYQGVISRETTITHSGASSWKVNVLNSIRNANYPITLNVAQVYLTANVSTTISAWFYLDSANCAANITLRGYQIAGITTDQVATANSATVGSWQQVSMTFTPTASGVVTLESDVWITAGSNHNVYIDDLTLPTGIATVNMEQPYFGTPWVQNQAASGAVSVAYAAVGL